LNVLVERLIAQNQIADSIGAASSEVLQVVIVRPVDDSLWEPELRVPPRDGPAQKPTWPLILQEIGNAFGDCAPREVNSRCGRERVLTRCKRVQLPHEVHVAGLIDSTQFPLRANVPNRTKQPVSRASRNAQP